MHTYTYSTCIEHIEYSYTLMAFPINGANHVEEAETILITAGIQIRALSLPSFWGPKAEGRRSSRHAAANGDFVPHPLPPGRKLPLTVGNLPHLTAKEGRGGCESSLLRKVQMRPPY